LTQLTISIDEYLNTHFGDHEPEFVHGELIARAMANVTHGWLQALLSFHLKDVRFCVFNISMRVAADIVRIADVAVFSTFPNEPIPSQPPLLVIEIISPEDLHTEVLRKLEDYRTWGVQHIWVIQPELKRFHVYESRSLVEVSQFELPEQNIRIGADELFAEATN